ncbi:unnamed protein product [Adineta steineri]|uniref:Uncharacterized protein n=1 Tax=Adineta steineri TaxID=433720 RepID=A0A815HXP6_9BILA|nr:unnamed protein product [Adineta steineri]CAF3795851.1 unnamed protein product [Adineta steineri]
MCITIYSINALEVDSSPHLLYGCYAFTWTALSTGNLTLTFEIYNYRSYWYLDSVSVTNGSTELLINGGFESGSFMPGWNLIASNCDYSCLFPQFTGTLFSFPPKEGRFQFVGHYNGQVPDTITQSFPVIANSTYTVRFWLLDLGGSSNKYVRVTLS